MASASETTRQREALKKVNSSASWAKQVNLMLPDQVAALYLRLKSIGKVR